jgi:hypothetical protein
VTDSKNPGPPASRRSSARREASDCVVLRGPGYEETAWTLNVSEGGMRLIVEEPLKVGALLDVESRSEPARRVRVVWTQDESDGQIIGVQFIDP